MKPWQIVLAAVAFVSLIVLTLLVGESPVKEEKSQVPKELPKPSIGGVAENVAAARPPQTLVLPLAGKLSDQIAQLELAGDRTSSPAIEQPGSFDQLRDSQLSDGDLVLGVAIDGSARAYSLKQLSAPGQTVVNDQLNDQTLVITWNPQNRSAVVFKNPPGELQLVFRSTGQTWKTDLVFEDLSTESKWSQSLGQCVQGSLRGTSLRAVPSMVCTWKAWRRAFPNSTLARLPEPASNSVATTSEPARSAARNKGNVLVLSQAGELLVSREKLLKEQVINSEINGEKVVVFYNQDADSVDAFNSVLVVPPALTFELRGLQFAQVGIDAGWNIQHGGPEDDPNPVRRLQRLVVVEIPGELESLRTAAAR